MRLTAVLGFAQKGGQPPSHRVTIRVQTTTERGQAPFLRKAAVLACLLVVPANVMADDLPKPISLSPSGRLEAYPTVVLADDPPKPISPAEAAKKVNEKVTVSMLVRSTGGRGNCYLNSEEDFNLATNFTIFISKDVKEKFKKAGIDNPAEYYKQKTIEVSGKVILFEDKPRIPITEPEQIKVIEKAKGRGEMENEK